MLSGKHISAYWENYQERGNQPRAVIVNKGSSQNAPQPLPKICSRRYADVDSLKLQATYGQWWG